MKAPDVRRVRLPGSEEYYFLIFFFQQPLAQKVGDKGLCAPDVTLQTYCEFLYSRGEGEVNPQALQFAKAPAL